MKIKRTERGWAGHFVCSDRCLFRRNTLLQYGKKYIVISTVGAMKPLEGYERETVGGMESIGYDRYYETYSFRADPNDKIYYDINVSEQVYASDNTKWEINKKEIENNKDSIDSIANKMHEDYVEAIEEMLINGEL